jgi:hypothetical protein
MLGPSQICWFGLYSSEVPSLGLVTSDADFFLLPPLVAVPRTNCRDHYLCADPILKPQLLMYTMLSRSSRSSVTTSVKARFSRHRHR